jgi:hypothetical protein
MDHAGRYVSHDGREPPGSPWGYCDPTAASFQRSACAGTRTQPVRYRERDRPPIPPAPHWPATRRAARHTPAASSQSIRRVVKRRIQPHRHRAIPARTPPNRPAHCDLRDTRCTQSRVRPPPPIPSAPASAERRRQRQCRSNDDLRRPTLSASMPMKGADTATSSVEASSVRLTPALPTWNAAPAGAESAAWRTGSGRRRFPPMRPSMPAGRLPAASGSAVTPLAPV